LAILPNRDISLTGKNLHPYPDARYANEALTILLNEILRLIGHKDISLKAKLAGGAQMFKGNLSHINTSESNKSSSGFTKKGFPLIGYKNIVAIKQELLKANIPLESNDLGGEHGRTVTFDPLSGEMLVRKIGQSQELSL
jgi:chemotaxis protein CheD